MDSKLFQTGDVVYFKPDRTEYSVYTFLRKFTVVKSMDALTENWYWVETGTTKRGTVPESHLIFPDELKKMTHDMINQYGLRTIEPIFRLFSVGNVVQVIGRSELFVVTRWLDADGQHGPFERYGIKQARLDSWSRWEGYGGELVFRLDELEFCTVNYGRGAQGRHLGEFIRQWRRDCIVPIIDNSRRITLDLEKAVVLAELLRRIAAEEDPGDWYELRRLREPDSQNAELGSAESRSAADIIGILSNEVKKRKRALMNAEDNGAESDEDEDDTFPQAMRVASKRIRRELDELDELEERQYGQEAEEAEVGTARLDNVQDFGGINGN